MPFVKATAMAYDLHRKARAGAERMRVKDTEIAKKDNSMEALTTGKFINKEDTYYSESVQDVYIYIY